MGVGVQRQVAHDQRSRAPGRTAAQQGPHAGQQLLALEGLDQVVVGAGVQPLDPGLDGVAGGQDEDRDVVAIAQPAGHVDAVQSGEAQVEDDHVWREGGGGVQGGLAVAGHPDLVALDAQGALQGLSDLVVVLDDEHPGGATEVLHGAKGKGHARRRPRVHVAARRRKKPNRGRRSLTAALRLSGLEQRHLDLIGLGLVALGLFLAFVLYLGWAGGQVGEGLADGLTYALGVVRLAVPAGLVAAGVILVLRPMLPTTRPFVPGAVCLIAALTLMLAAGTLGLGPDGARASFWDRPFFEARGGVVGEGELWLTSTLLGTIGTHLVAVFLLVAGVLLLTGATVAGVVRAAGLRARAGSERLRQTAVHARHRVTTLAPPDPGPDEITVRSRPAAGDLDAQARYPDLFGDEAATAVQGDDGAPGAADDEPEGGSGAPPAEELVELEPEAVEDLEGTAAHEPPRTPAAGVDAADLTPRGRLRASVTEAEDFVWAVPSPRLLKRSGKEASKPDTAGQEKTATQLLEALGHFGVQARVVGTVSGPHITRYELRLAPGIKVAKVAQLKDDLAYALAAEEIRILAPIPGKQAVGVEVPNRTRRIVTLGDVFSEPPADWSPLTVWLGKDVAGRAIGADLAKMPHLLVAGTTGAGKSGAINAMLSSILLRATPRDVRMVLVDPKQVELNHYESIPHLLTPVITSPRMAANALANLVREMEQRYGLMSIMRTRSLVELNRRREERGEARLPYVLCVIDELADLMMVAPADVEDAIIRLAQKARAVGIHLVLATQSPRVDVITGMIKANVPSRIAFAVSSQTDSRVILDQNGAESLLGRGDLLFSPVGTSRLQRIQGAYIDEEQIAALTGYWRRQGEPEIHEELLEEVVEETGAGERPEDELDPDDDPLLEDAIALVAQMGTASTSMLQRRLRLGYTRAGRLIDMLERRGVISGYEGSKPRQVLISEADLPRVLATLGGGESPAPDAAPDVDEIDR